jgi:hypothetical protein
MTDTEYLGWMNEPWYVRSVTGDPGVMTTDTLFFSATTIDLQKSGETSTTPWGVCQVTNDGLSGIRSSDGQPFLIQRDPGTGLITCTFPSNTLQRQIRTVTLGTFLGTLAGALVGLAAGSPWLGGGIGLIAALTGSATTAGTSALQNRTDTGTFVAEEGSATGRLPYPQRSSLKAVSA